MTKDILVAIKGLQFEGGIDSDEIETITKGQYYKRNGSHYVLYDEVAEGFGGETKNIIKFREKKLNLTKRGLVNVQMVFEENKKNMTNYNTPFGDILVGIDTSRVGMEEEEGRIVVNVDYSLEVNYEYVADCKITMDIRSKDNAGFVLQS